MDDKQERFQNRTAPGDHNDLLKVVCALKGEQEGCRSDVANVALALNVLDRVCVVDRNLLGAMKEEQEAQSDEIDRLGIAARGHGTELAEVATNAEQCAKLHDLAASANATNEQAIALLSDAIAAGPAEGDAR